MALAVRFDLAPERAIEFFREKGLKTSFAWQDMLHEEHDRAFTVAKMMDLDLLSDVKAHVDRAIAEGRTFREFARDLQPELMRRGWWGKAEMTDPLTGEHKLVQLGSPRRLQTIFRTNLRTAYAAGHWARIRETAESAPYLMYTAVLDARTRPQHRAWHGTVLPWDHPWWRTHTPPNGWNCRCTVIQLSRRDLEKLGKSGPDDPPPSPTRSWTNPRTGEVLEVPVGVDPGWGYAPGRSRLDDLVGPLTEKLADAPAELGAAAWQSLRSLALPALQREWSAWLQEVFARGEPRRDVRVYGFWDADELAFFAARGRPSETAEVAVDDRLIIGRKQLRHERSGDALSREDWERLPETFARQRVTLWDHEKRNALVVLPAADDPRRLRLAIEPGFKQRRRRGEINMTRSAQKIPLEDLRGGLKGGRYAIVKGQL